MPLGLRNIYAALTASVEEVTTLAQNNTRLVVKHAVITASASGNNTIVAAVTGYRIVLLAYNYMSNGIVNAKWRSNSTDITGLGYMDAAGRGKVCGYNPKGWCKTATGEALNLNLSAAIAVGGEITYVEILP